MNEWQVTRAWDDPQEKSILVKRNKKEQLPFYSNREDKYTWLYMTFREIFNKANDVLDIGCDTQKLKLYCGKKYVGLDMSKEADVQWNLDCGKPLPFKTKSFDVVVCLDTLEHIESIHDTFDELCRVSADYIFIILPNPYQSIVSYWNRKENEKDRKQFGKYSKFYGLPFEKPIDRHRWFYSWEESAEFVRYKAEKNDYSVKLLCSDLEFKPFSIKTFLLGLIDKNLTKSQMICVLRRKK